MYKGIPVVIVAAISRQRRTLGQGNDLLWHIPEDLARFRDLTRGKPVVMGRKTFESIIAIRGNPLPERPNIVVTRNGDYAYEHELVSVVDSLEAGFAVALTHDPEEIHIGGGAQLYAQSLPYVDRLHLTLVDDEPEADTFFPEYADQFIQTHASGPQKYKSLTYEWVDFVRKA